MDQALGVADGVGGWVLSGEFWGCVVGKIETPTVGIDPSLYSRALCKGALDAAKYREKNPNILF